MRAFARVSVLTLLVSLTTPAALSLLSTCGTATFQEGNPIPFALAIRRLERTGAQITRVCGSGRLRMSRATLEGRRAFDRALAEQGWRFEDQMESVILYRKGDRRLRV